MNRQIILICVFLFAFYRFTKAEDELKIEVIDKPSADKCQRTTKDGDTLSIHYTGRLAKTGKVFDSSRDRKEPFEFTLGKGMVIQGYEQGLKDMCVGEHRKLTIPSHLAYGEEGFGETIPGKSTLLFDVELLEIKKGTSNPEADVFGRIDTDDNKELSREEVSKYLKEHGNIPEGDDESKQDIMISEIFQEEDKDKDGVISLQEFSGPKHEEL